MARIPGVSEKDAQQDVRQALGYARSGFAQMTGRETDRMIEPLELYAREPGLLSAVGSLAQVSGELHHLPQRIQALVGLKAATLTHCEYCIDLGSQVSRRLGLSDEELLALPNYRSRACFSDAEKLALEYAVGMSRTPVEVSDELFGRLKQHFDDDQLLELTHLIALENMYGRFNLALGVGSAGFTEGMVCAVPAAS
jgi:AhpD family alkylhydroperoxidase